VPGERVAAELRAILDSIAAGDPDFRAEVKLGLVRVPFEVAEDAPVVQVLRAAASAPLG
jgi:hypothetical protein